MKRGGATKARVRSMLTGAMLVLLSVPAAAAEPLLIDVLNAFEADGYAFVYSSDVARSRRTIPFDLDGPRSIPALEAALQKIGLALERGDNSNGQETWYVVPQASAASTGWIEGRITDSASGVPLAGVRVEIAGQVVYTDDDGRFVFSGQSGPPIIVSRAGNQPVEEPIDKRLDAILEISLTPERRLEEVVVVSSRYALEQTSGSSVHTLTAHDLNTTPEFGDDALRASNHLPGMATIGLSARPYIRGGLQDETLVLFNDLELLEPFHLKDFQSVFSGFNPSLVKSIDVYTGGFPARYGDRMSGVMDIKPTDDIPPLGIDLMVSFLTASAALMGTTG
ncbi:MAG: TonB-dependent receptor plug domain-containing protein, partial [Gammaproteobacteria bacterium]